MCGRDRAIVVTTNLFMVYMTLVRILIADGCVHVLRENGRVTCRLSNRQGGRMMMRGARDGLVEFTLPDDFPDARSVLVELGKITVEREVPGDTHWRIVKYWP